MVAAVGSRPAAQGCETSARPRWSSASRHHRAGVRRARQRRRSDAGRSVQSRWRRWFCAVHRHGVDQPTTIHFEAERLSGAKSLVRSLFAPRSGLISAIWWHCWPPGRSIRRSGCGRRGMRCRTRPRRCSTVGSPARRYWTWTDGCWRLPRGRTRGPEPCGGAGQAARLAERCWPCRPQRRDQWLPAERDFAVLTARDADGRLWTSALIASAGFLEARDRELTVHAAPGSGDAFHGLAEGQAVGLLAIELQHAPGEGERHADLRRYRRTADRRRPAFGNCPKYIQQRRLVHTESSEPATERLVRSATLGDEDVR